MNDNTLRQLVLDELEYDPSIDARHIAATVHQGVVTLSGRVPSYAQKLAAERATWRVKGVKAIAEEIEVRLDSDQAQSDEEIARRAIDMLKWNTLIPGEAIKVQVSKGWVTLGGEVDWNYQQFETEQGVRTLRGVTGITNNISLKHKADAGDLKKRIVDALKRHAEVEASRLRVEVLSGGTVRLEGDVDNWDERQAVEQAAWSSPGVQRVDDRLRIQ